MTLVSHLICLCWCGVSFELLLSDLCVDFQFCLLPPECTIVHVDQKEDEDHCVSGLGNPVGTEEAEDIDDENEQAYILKARIVTPKIPQKNLTFRKFIQKCHKNGTKMTQNGPNWPKYDPK